MLSTMLAIEKLSVKGAQAFSGSLNIKSSLGQSIIITLWYIGCFLYFCGTEVSKVSRTLSRCNVCRKMLPALST